MSEKGWGVGRSEVFGGYYVNGMDGLGSNKLIFDAASRRWEEVVLRLLEAWSCLLVMYLSTLPLIHTYCQWQDLSI